MGSKVRLTHGCSVSAFPQAINPVFAGIVCRTVLIEATFFKIRLRRGIMFRLRFTYLILYSVDVQLMDMYDLLALIDIP